MPDFRIDVELGHLLPTGSVLDASIFPTLSFAVQKISEAAHQQWVAYASGAPMPTGKVIQSQTGEYARSILLRQVGDFAAEVYSDLAYAQAIEEGTPERDQKKMLASSLKVRLTHDGKRYLIIPFRHNHPNSVMGNNMPEAVHSWWNNGRSPSSISGTYQRVSGTGALDIKTRTVVTVPGWKYKWGTRLRAGDLAELGIEGAQARRLEGMVNFRKPASAGSGSHSQFITFRTMVEGSKGWVSPAVPGKWPARTVAEQLQPVAEQAFTRAVEEDVARLVGGET